jgi:hypothetical protein
MTAHALAWRAWPLRRRPVLGAAATVVAAGTVAGVWSWTGSLFLCMLATGILAAAAGPFFVPTRYRLTPDGLEVARLFFARRRAWGEFRAVHRDREAIVLTPSRGRAWLPRSETLFVEGNGDEVRAYVEEMVVAARGARDG